MVAPPPAHDDDAPGADALPEDLTAPDPGAGRRLFAAAGLAVVLWLETLLMTIVTIVLIVDLAVRRPSSYPSAIAILILAIVAAVWLGFAARAAPHRRSWVRAAAITWQVMQGAAAAGAVTDSGQPLLSWLVLLLAVAGLLFALIMRDRRPAPEEGGL